MKLAGIFFLICTGVLCAEFKSFSERFPANVKALATVNGSEYENYSTAVIVRYSNVTKIYDQGLTFVCKYTCQYKIENFCDFEDVIFQFSAHECVTQKVTEVLFYNPRTNKVLFLSTNKIYDVPPAKVKAKK